MSVLVATFHVKDELDGTGMRCGTRSEPWLDRDGEHPPVNCSRHQDHAARGSDLHRAVVRGRDVYWMPK